MICIVKHSETNQKHRIEDKVKLDHTEHELLPEYLERPANSGRQDRIDNASKLTSNIF